MKSNIGTYIAHTYVYVDIFAESSEKHKESMFI